MGGGMAGTYFHVWGARKLSDDIDDTETIDLAVHADGGHAGASAPTADPAGAYSAAGASAPTMAAAGAYITVTGATSAAAEIVSPPGSCAGAGALTPADPRTYIPITEATSTAAETIDAAGACSTAGASAPTTDPAGTYS